MSAETKRRSFGIPLKLGAVLTTLFLLAALPEAVNAAGIKSVDLPDPVFETTVPVGTEIEDAGLPATLEVTLEDGSKGSAAVLWDDGGLYEKDKAGTYVLTADFPGYSYSLAHPFAKVTVFSGATEDAAAGRCGPDAFYSVDTHKGILEITGFGDMYDWDSAKAPWADYAPSISYVDINEGITYIGSGSFFEFNKVASVKLPASVKSVGQNAFSAATVEEQPANEETLSTADWQKLVRLNGSIPRLAGALGGRTYIFILSAACVQLVLCLALSGTEGKADVPRSKYTR